MRNPIRAAFLTAVLVVEVYGSRPIGSSFGIPGTNANYDYVVVGGGNAGLTLASRLVEQKAGSVAVIEAGTFYETGTGNITEVPGTASTWSGSSTQDWQPMADWGYITTPQAGADNKTMHYPRGKMLGGCSARNFLIYQRGTEGSYKMWADKVGDDSYAFESFLPYFEKSLNFTPPNQELRAKNATPDYDASVLGPGSRAGPVSVTFPNWGYAFPTWATKAFSQIGILPRKGFLSGGLLGQAWAMFTIDATTMARSSSETAFLQHSLSDPNYYVYPLTLAKKVLFDDSKKATGVLVETGGFEYTISARKEVILSAGVFGSPQLLQVSGIGPAKLLNSLKIPVIADRPGVGRNMQDHIFFGIAHGVDVVTASSLGNPEFYAEQTRLFDEKAEGLLTSPASDMLGWEKLPNKTRSGLSNRTRSILATDYPADWPEIEYIAFSAYYSNGSVISRSDPQDGTAYATLGVALCTPQSRGSVTITSADARDKPDIDPGFLTDRADIEVVIGGFKRAREFWKSRALHGLLVGEESYPGLDVQTDAQIEAVIRRSFQTVYHGSCTCAMGKANDTDAVVDAQARVYGVKGLRVVDAAAFPLLPPGHPMATVYALAEKIACDISGNC
ncbi:glucose-methanol-choline oxidoreductase [Xylariaceae sp. FL0662B]|nr:glucose-methanol-choline oxidoreductase [Xylariaceae sp. FL0662B]